MRTQQFVIHGTRGSMPSGGRNFLKYGGDTTCFSLKTDGHLVIFDAGTGIASLNALFEDARQLPQITIMFTHFHLDHVIGLPLFAPLHDRHASINFMADPGREDEWRATIHRLIAGPYWPASLSEAPSDKTFSDLPRGQDGIEVDGISISWCPVSHPQGCLAYKISGPGGAIVIATDHEHADSDLSAGFLEFCAGADFLLYDAMYTPEEYRTRRGWGHGNWHQGVQLAIEAGIGELLLTHHDIGRTDEQLDAIVSLARDFFPRTTAAAPGMALSRGRRS